MASLRVCELQRIDADELGQAGMQNGLARRWDRIGDARAYAEARWVWLAS